MAAPGQKMARFWPQEVTTVTNQAVKMLPPILAATEYICVVKIFLNEVGKRGGGDYRNINVLPYYSCCLLVSSCSEG